MSAKKHTSEYNDEEFNFNFKLIEGILLNNN